MSTTTAVMMESNRACPPTTVGFHVRAVAGAPPLPRDSPFSAIAAQQQQESERQGRAKAVTCPSSVLPAAGGKVAAVISGLSPPPLSVLVPPPPFTLPPRDGSETGYFVAKPHPMPAASTPGGAPSATMRTAPASPSTPSTVQLGWQGLLEISRNSGASGVLGAKIAADEDPDKDCKIEICCTAHPRPAVRRLVKGVIRGLKGCQEPEKAKEGMGGTYFFMNELGRKAAILKPCDEEPLAPNNPKGYVGRSLGEPGWKPTVRVGEAAMREVAAFLLDHEGWAKVPTTTLVRARHPVFCYNSRMSSVRQSSLDLTGLAAAPSTCSMDLGSNASDQTVAYQALLPADVDASGGSSGALPMKLGSLQEFVTHMCDTSEMGPGRFSVRDVHRIGILDIRLFNTDRHAGNMLVRAARQPSSANLAGRTPLMAAGLMGGESAYELIPIDHGFCLPETLEACYFEWLHWPQAMLPFSEEELAYIDKLDVEADKQLLRQELPNLRPECLRVMELATTLLKRGAKAGLTLHEIAAVMTRPYEGGEDEEPSELEKLAGCARHALLQAELDSSDDDGGDSVIDEEGEGDCEGEEEPDVSVDVRSAAVVVAAGGVVAMGHSVLGGAPNTPGPSRLSVRRGGEESPHNLMFEFEDDPSSGTPRVSVEGGSPGAHGCSALVGAASLGSSLASSADDFSFGLPSSGSPMVTATPSALGGAPSRRGSELAAGKGVATLEMATSVHVAEGGFLWRRYKARSAAKQRMGAGGAGGKRSHGGGGGGGSGGRCGGVRYPPPVAAFSPESLNGLFSDINDAEWAGFMRLWTEALEEALTKGSLKSRLGGDASGGAAHSCPRF